MSRFGIFFVSVYFAHAILSVSYGVTIADPKGQAIYFTLPLLLTPETLYSLLPTVHVSNYETFLQSVIIRYPLAFLFSVTVLFYLGKFLENLSLRGHLWAVLAGLVIGLPIGILWQIIAHLPATLPLWFVLALIGGFFGQVVHNARVKKSDYKVRA